MTVHAPVIAPMKSVRIRWCVLCLGSVFVYAAWGDPSEVVAQGGHFSTANVPVPSALLPSHNGPKDPRLPSSGVLGTDPTLSSLLLRSGDLELHDTPLADALFTISNIWKVNLVVGQEAVGDVVGPPLVFEHQTVERFLVALEGRRDQLAVRALLLGAGPTDHAPYLG